MVKDSEIWERAYKAYKAKSYKPTKVKSKSKIVPKPIKNDEVLIVSELQQLNTQIKLLKARKAALNKQLKDIKINKPRRSNIWLYALLLNGGRYYIGVTTNVDKRFARHAKGKGAKWTKLHKPISIIETMDTGLKSMEEAALLEDEWTIRYARTYGTDIVRGGGYCQTKPRWPEIAYEPIVNIS